MAKTINWPDWAAYAQKLFGLRGRVSLQLDETAVPTVPLVAESSPFNSVPIVCGGFGNENAHVLNLSPVGVRPTAGGILVVRGLMFHRPGADLTVDVGLVTPLEVSTNVALTDEVQLVNMQSPMFIAAGVTFVTLNQHLLWRGDAAAGLVVNVLARIQLESAAVHSPQPIMFPGKGIVLDGTDPLGFLHLVTLPLDVNTQHPGATFFCEAWPGLR